jgi:hypothetical protein
MSEHIVSLITGISYCRHRHFLIIVQHGTEKPAEDELQKAVREGPKPRRPARPEHAIYNVKAKKGVMSKIISYLASLWTAQNVI